MPQRERRPRPVRPGPKLQLPDAVAQVPAPETLDPPVKLDDKVTVTHENVQYEIRALDLVKLKELGRGAYGVVETMRHPPSGLIMAVKRIHVTLNHEERKRMQNEVTASMKSGQCPFMVLFYGAMFREGDVWICMEVMDSSLDKLVNMMLDQDETLPADILGRTAYSVLQGLAFMKEELNLMHRDVKPSNILINRRGQIKICDFGISGHLTNSVAKTIQAGCKPYMAPERINPSNETQEKGFDIRSDVWSLGITMIELATGVHPYDRWKTPFEQLKQVVEQPPPKLPEDGFPPEVCEFVSKCLLKNYHDRPKFRALLEEPWIKHCASIDDAVVAEFVCRILDRYQAQEAQMANCLANMDIEPGGPVQMGFRRSTASRSASTTTLGGSSDELLTGGTTANTAEEGSASSRPPIFSRPPLPPPNVAMAFGDVNSSSPSSSGDSEKVRPSFVAPNEPE